MDDPLLTIIVPAFNESATIAPLLDAVVAAPYAKQVVVVDDGSTDATPETLRRWRERTGAAVEVVRHPANRGKGAAVRTGLERARGRITLVQDADLEYDT